MNGRGAAPPPSTDPLAGTTMSTGTPNDPDDFFAETRMSFGDHIEELRTHLWRAIAGFGVALFLSLFIGHHVVRFITAPVEQQLQKFRERRNREVLVQALKDSTLQELNRPTAARETLVYRDRLDAVLKGVPTEQINQMPKVRIITKEMQKEREAQKNPGLFQRVENLFSSPTKDPTYPEGPGEVKEVLEQDVDKHFVRLPTSVADPLYSAYDQQLAQGVLTEANKPTTLNVQEAFMVWFKVCMVCGVVLGSPWIFWQIWMFVAAGLYPHEKKLVHVYLPVSLFLFLLGVAVCEFLVLPRAIEALLWFNEWIGIKPDIRLNEWLSFAIYMPLVFGASFQTPLVMLFLNRLGVMDLDSFRNKRRIAWFAMAVFAAVITPSTDAFSMLFLWVPMSLLFELGILLIKLTPTQPDLEIDVPESGELVEV
jgi:sec-independent protein translocase protein TatC